MVTAAEGLRVAAIADVHCNEASHGQLQPLFAHMAEEADVLLLCGDLTDHGLTGEAHILAQELAPTSGMPVLAVLGNHDFESGKQDEITRMLADAGVMMLDGHAHVIDGVGFVGVKGFGGGFGSHVLQPWGEPAIKAFVREAVEETLKLESALSRLKTPRRVAVLHYAPIERTVQGEPPPLYPFLGSSRMEEPLNRFPVTAVFHGHAHHGSPEGRTGANVPVYNVSVPVLLRSYPQRLPFRTVEIGAAAANGGLEQAAAPVCVRS